MNSEQVKELVHTMLFVLQELGGKADFHRVFKMLYIADKEHLKEYGTHIMDDKYIAMKYGPVPSLAYDILKSLRPGNSRQDLRDLASPFLELTGSREVQAKELPDLDELAPSHIRFLKSVIQRFGNKDFGYLSEFSHDDAYFHAKKRSDNKMHYTKIAKAGGADQDMLTFIKENLENENAVL